MKLRTRQRFGKYKIEKQISNGGFANVYRAMDTIEGIRVALKIPDEKLMDDEFIENFRNEVRVSARLDHPNILLLKDANFIEKHFVIATRLGEMTLADRLRHRLSATNALDYTYQLLDAVAYAHRHRVIHCDIKPENIIMFPDEKLRLSDFGIAKVALKTIKASGSGTLGHMAPEQAMGKPSFRSDVFSIGLILYRMYAGKWPEWPFEWPPPGIKRLRSNTHRDLVNLIHKAIEVNPRKRFRDAMAMFQEFRRIQLRSIRFIERKKRK